MPDTTSDDEAGILFEQIDRGAAPSPAPANDSAPPQKGPHSGHGKVHAAKPWKAKHGKPTAAKRKG